MNQNLIYYVRRHKIFLSILTVVLLLGLVGNVNKFNNLPEFVDPITTTTMDPNGKHALPGKYNLVRDVLRMNGSMRRPNKKCSVDYMNKERLPQDHPCVVNNARTKIDDPFGREVEYSLDYPEVADPSDGQAKTVLHLLKNKTNGFFVECGALDGENISNTLYMERSFNWTGLLVEADRESYNLLRSRKRKSWASNACLSSDPFPKEVSFRSSYALGHIVDEYEPVKNLSGIMSAYGQTITTQCFPLYTMLLALNRTTVDYFSLDVEGYELHVLKTIPFDEIDIQVLSVEWIAGEDQFIRRKETISFMLSQGYEPFNSRLYGADVFFVKKNSPLMADITIHDTIIQKYKP